jgi:choloylglycine hydrolase
MLWLDLTHYGGAEQKEYLNELEWIQYQLDNYATVQEMLDHVNERTIHAFKGKIHYIATDPTGQSATIEFLNQKTSSSPMACCNARLFPIIPCRCRCSIISASPPS